MKKLLLIIAVLLLFSGAQAQSPPAGVYGGSLFTNGGHATFAMWTTGNINIMSNAGFGLFLDDII